MVPANAMARRHAVEGEPFVFLRRVAEVCVPGRPLTSRSSQLSDGCSLVLLLGSMVNERMCSSPQ